MCEAFAAFYKLDCALACNITPRGDSLCEVEKGRAIYAGIQKFVAFIMSVHIAEACAARTCIHDFTMRVYASPSR